MVGFIIFGQSVQSYYMGFYDSSAFLCFVRPSLNQRPRGFSAR